MKLFSLAPHEPVQELPTQNLHKRPGTAHRTSLLEAHEAEELHTGHIPGAVLIPTGGLKKRVREFPRGVDVVWICASGHHSLPAVRTLAAAGTPPAA